MRRRHVSDYINIYFISILTLAIVILGTLIGYHTIKTAEENVLSRLDIAQKVAENQLTAHDAAIYSQLREITHYENMAAFISEQDTASLDLILEHIKTGTDTSENRYYLIVDKDGIILSSTDHPSFSKWELSYLLQYLDNTEDPLSTTEIYTKNTIVSASPRFRQQILLPDEGKNAETAMVHLVLCPVRDAAHIAGAVVGGYIINNSKTLASAYTKTVPDTFLSVGTTTGLRICSNIDVDNYSLLAGTMQNEQLVNTTNRGESWRSKTITNNKENAFIVSNPLYNCKGEIIGNIGVGAPSFLFPEIGYQSIIFSTTICLILLIITALALSFLSKKLTSPIYKLQKFSRTIAVEKVLPERIIWKNQFIPQELLDLADDMTNMALTLTTENIRLEEKVKNRTVHLQHTIQELEAANQHKSQFLANVSHELRTPLNSIIGFASLIQDELYGELNQKQKEYISVIMYNSEHLLKLINNILQVTKLNNHVEKLNIQKVSVPELLRTAAQSLGPLIQNKKQKFTLDIPDVCGFYACWDEQKIRQVILNLLSNAVKYTSEGGQIHLGLSSHGTDYILNVTDNGSGIDDSLKEKVFLPFEQIDTDYTRTHQGVGLGLSICREFVKLHNGKIWIEDNPDGGTIVYIRLPSKL